MVKPFLDDLFLLESDVAIELYQGFAAPLPIVDYHNHLSPRDVAQNRTFANITEAWLEDDHYKWRAMRINGVAEKFCTGNASPQDKFVAWAKTVPYTLRNPLYHWTHLELKNYFDVRKPLDESSSDEIYETCSAMLQRDDFRVQSLLKKMKVEVICTTDDPADSLEFHQQLARDHRDLKMYPSFRPDLAYTTHDPANYNNYLVRLSTAAGSPIQTFDDLLGALRKRMDFFNAHGCRSADHGPEFMYFDDDALTHGPMLFRKIRDGKALAKGEQVELRAAVLAALCKEYHQLGWVQQFHIGALRNNNSRMEKLAGQNTGFDSIGDFSHAQHMALFFNHLDSTNQLARTVIYNSNPAHNEVFATMAGNFSDGSEPGKVQWGSGWWFLDQKDGMERQLNALSNMGLLSRFVGMVTDSRSFLSFPRHEYFRRILCNVVGRDVVKGELPNDLALLGRLVGDICYTNTKAFFRL